MVIEMLIENENLLFRNEKNTTTSAQYCSCTDTKKPIIHCQKCLKNNIQKQNMLGKKENLELKYNDFLIS